MRIISGKFKNYKLPPLPEASSQLHLRPTSERTREGIFNILTHNNFTDIENARVLDLFAGTGAMGLEALSRGAAFVTFVECNPHPRAIIQNSIKTLNLSTQTQVLGEDASNMRQNKASPYNITFMDPPYDQVNALLPKTLDHLLQGQWVDARSVIICEFAAKHPPPLPRAGWSCIKEKRYGKSGVYFLRYETNKLF